MHMNFSQAARDMGVSRQWIHRLVKTGVLTTESIAGYKLIFVDQQFERVKEEIAARKRGELIENGVTRGRGRPPNDDSPSVRGVAMSVKGAENA